MSTSTAINPKGPRVVAPGATPANWAEAYLGSSVGQKIIVAGSGLGLVGFAFFHMLGNLKMFQGPEAINHYAAFLKHDLGALIWIARGGLLALFLFHLTVALRLQLKARAARPIGYVFQRSAQATAASKTMMWTGIVIGAFIVFHLAHYTFGLVQTVIGTDGKPYSLLDYRDELGRHDVYRMVISGFGSPATAVLYLLAQIVLFVHLSHGIPSSLQTLGLTGKRFAPAAKWLGYALAGTILLGNAAIIGAVWGGWVK